MNAYREKSYRIFLYYFQSPILICKLKYLNKIVMLIESNI